MFLFGFHFYSSTIGDSMYIGLGTIVLIVILFVIFKR